MGANSTTFVRLRFPLFRVSLSLKRVPKYLRFVCSGYAGCDRSWDALDQLNDEPKPGEQLFAAVLAHRGTLHLDRTVNRRRVGEWHDTAEYELVEPQPPQEVMQVREKWQAWCADQETQK